ncbi:MAG: hypothetical protein AABW99_02555 [archaeon]
MKIAFFALLSALLLSGCLENPGIEDRLACLELSSYSFTSIPNCGSQDKCFQEAEKAFPLNDSPFSARVKTELFNAKNHLAKQWVFLNAAKANLKVIHEQCYSENTLSLVPKNVNELNNNILGLGKEIDSFNESAAKAILFELSALEEDDVNLMRSSPLYDDYIVLNQNVVDFSRKNLFGKTYASRFLSGIRKFSDLYSSVSNAKPVPELTLFDVLSENDKAILSELRKKDFPIPFISPVFSGVSDFMRNFVILRDSIAALSALPSFDAFLAINSISGAQNSATSAFFETFSNDSEHRQALTKKNSAQRQEINNSLETAQQKKDFLAQQLGESFFAGLFTRLESSFPESIEASRISLEDAQGFSAEFRERIDVLHSKLYSLDEARAMGSLPLGLETSMLSQVSSETKQLLSELGFYESQLDSLRQKCAEKLAEIKNSGAVQAPYPDPVMISLKSRLNSKIALFLQTQNLGDCGDAILASEKISELAQESRQDYSVESAISLCVSDAEQLSKNVSSADLNAQLASLKSIPAPYDNPELVLNSCESIRQSFAGLLSKSSGFTKAGQNYFAALEKTLLLESFLNEFPFLSCESKFVKLRGETLSYAQYFGSADSVTANLPESAAIAKVNSLGAEIDSLSAECLAEAFRKYSMQESYGNDSGEKFFRAALENTAPAIGIPFAVEIPFDSRQKEIFFSTPNVSARQSGTKTALLFSSLLGGLNSIVFGDAQGNATKAALPNPPQEQVPGKTQAIAPADPDNFSSDEFLKQKALLVAQRISGLGALQKSLSEETALLEKNFSSLSAEELAQVYAYSPITKGRLAELKKLASANFGTAKQKFDALLQAGDYRGAMAVAEQFKLEDNYSALEQAEKEAAASIEKLKENALSAYNVAVSKRNTSQKAAEVDSMLVSAKSDLEQKSYLKSIAGSSKASSLAVLPKNTLEIPVAVYPLLAVILGVAYYVYRKSEEEKKPKPVLKIERIESDSEKS